MKRTVHLTRPSLGLAVVEMADREHSNLLTESLVTGLLEAFEAVGADPEVRAVVVHGYDSVFSTGGTREELLGIVEGRISFDDVPLYRLFLDCAVPVVAAMQGHALGGGLVIGLFADVVILAEEAVYSASFMKYGFTPGMGATLILPERFGSTLAQEMLLTAGSYRGRDLRERGAACLVLPRAQVIERALAIGRDLAEKPRAPLALLKRRLSAGIAERLPAAVAEELRMHEATFREPEVRRRIETLFGDR